MHSHFKIFAVAIAAMIVAVLATTASAAEPIRIGVIAPTATINGKAIMQATSMAADEINAKGGVNGRQIKLYQLDDNSSATASVRDFQRLVQQDHVIAVVGTYISEAALATEPWAARLKEPYIITGAAATKIAKRVHNGYNQYKYVFMMNPTSAGYAKIVCAQSKGFLVDKLHYNTAVVMRENYAWTKPFYAVAKHCLPKAGLKILDTIVVAPNTKDFTPLYARIKQDKPDVIIGVFAHMGLKPTVQWHDQQVPMFLAGWSSQAGGGSFWDDTHGAAQGELTGNLGAPGASLTDKSVPFTKSYAKRFNTTPAYAAYSTYDAMYVLKNAIEHAGNTKAGDLVKALEQTDYTGVMGHIAFYPKSSEFAHSVKVGPGYITGVLIQWQNGKQVAVWPDKAANGKLIYPSFVPKSQ